MRGKAVMCLFREDVLKILAPVRDFHLLGCYIVNVLPCLREALTKRHIVLRAVSLGV
jgi:hypothetical protein